MQRFNQRQGFLVSAAIHLTLLMILIAHPPSMRRRPDVDPATLEKKDLVFLPPGSVLKKLIPLQPRPAPPKPQPSASPDLRPVPTPSPSSPPPAAKDRISIGPPSDHRLKGPVLLRREDDLTRSAARGRLPLPLAPTPPPQAAPPQPGKPGPAASGAVEGRKEAAGRPGLRLPPGLVQDASSGDEGQRGREGRAAADAPGSDDPLRPGTALDRSIASAVDQVTRRLQSDARRGIPTGTGRDLGGLYFDPQGADFTLWIQRFKDEVYRNWIAPQAVMLGVARGHVDFEFTVERNGTVSALRMLKSSGTASLDRAAQNALTSSRYLPLPDDYRPRSVTMQVSFFYNENPVSS